MHRLLKLLAFLIGAPMALLCSMAMVGALTPNVWIQLGASLALVLVLPLFIADRLLPKDDVAKGRGLPSNVLAVTWVLIPMLVLGIGLGWTSPLLHAEAAMLDQSAFHVASPILRGIALPEEVSNETEAIEVLKAAPPALVAVVQPPVLPEPATATVGEAPQAEDALEVLTPREIYEHWAPSVVAIHISMSGHDMGGGTGFVVGPELIVTNHHVVASGLATEGNPRPAGIRIQIKTMDGTWARRVFIVDFDADRDLALLRVDPADLAPPVTFASDDHVVVGSPAISIGNPLGLDHTLTDGLVSARRVYQGRRFVQISTPVSPGNSGGPVFDSQGRVIGVATQQVGSYSRGQNLNLAVPSSDVQTFLDHTPTIDSVQVGGGAPTQQNGSW